MLQIGILFCVLRLGEKFLQIVICPQFPVGMQAGRIIFLMRLCAASSALSCVNFCLHLSPKGISNLVLSWASKRARSRPILRPDGGKNVSALFLLPTALFPLSKVNYSLYF